VQDVQHGDRAAEVFHCDIREVQEVAGSADIIGSACGREWLKRYLNGLNP
jgi:hypothetical protein